MSVSWNEPGFADGVLNDRPRVGRAAVVAAVAVALATLSFGNGRATPTTTTVPNDRPATEQERHFCEELGYKTEGREAPKSGDCSRVPVDNDPIQEDDVWGRWDCRTMGNHICGPMDNLTIWFDFGGELQGYALNDPTRPGCFVEPSATPGGFEIIFHYRINLRTETLGFEVDCPDAVRSQLLPNTVRIEVHP